MKCRHTKVYMNALEDSLNRAMPSQIARLLKLYVKAKDEFANGAPANDGGSLKD